MKLLINNALINIPKEKPLNIIHKGKNSKKTKFDFKKYNIKNIKNVIENISIKCFIEKYCSLIMNVSFFEVTNPIIKPIKYNKFITKTLFIFNSFI